MDCGDKSSDICRDEIKVNTSIPQNSRKSTVTGPYVPELLDHMKIHEELVLPKTLRCTFK